MHKIFQLLRLINAGGKPWAIALGAALGILAGFLPLSCPIVWGLVALALVTRANLSAGMAFWSIGRLITISGGRAWFVQFGVWLHQLEVSGDLLGWIRRHPKVGMLGIEDPAILGGTALGILAAITVYWPVVQAIHWWRRFRQRRRQS